MKQGIILLYDFMRVTEEINPCISNQELLNERTARLLIQLFKYQGMQCNPCDQCDLHNCVNLMSLETNMQRNYKQKYLMDKNIVF